MKRTIAVFLILAAGVAIGVFIAGRGTNSGSTSTSAQPDKNSEPGANIANASTATGAQATQDWCSEHRVPESQCTKCKPALVERFKARNDWCNEHGVPESHCRLCNPNLEFPQEAALTGSQSKSVQDWCVEHRVPESQCTKCKPALVDAFKARNDWCNEHGLPESHCRLCNPKLAFPQAITLRSDEASMQLGVSVFFPSNQVICATNDAVIQFASSETATRSGFTLEPVAQVSSPTAAVAPAEVVFAQESEARITLPIRASVLHWLVDPGEIVESGRMLALCESPEAAHLKGEYLEASAEADKQDKNLVRQKEMRLRELIDAATLEAAEADAHAASSRLRSAEHELRALGLNDEDLAEVRVDGKLTARFALRAPISGTLVERIAPIGIALEEGTQLATIADPDDLWIEARIRDTDLPRIRLGQSAVFTSDGSNLDRSEAKVIWVSQYLDPGTRTGVVRAVPNGPPTQLRAHQFGHLDLLESESGTAVFVSKDAVQWEGCCHVVFVREAPDRFRPRKVALAKGDTEHYRVLSGLEPDEWVVVHGSFLLKTELKKSSIGAGCCGLDAKS